VALRDLLVKFGIEVDGRQKLDDTDAKIRKTLSGVDALGRSLKRLGYYMTAGFLLRGIKSLVSGQLEAADAMKHNAEKLGITTDELQKYEYAASQTQVPTRELAVAMRFFNRSVGEAALGTKSAVKTFAQLGIHVKDAGGNVRPTNELLFEFSDKLKAVPSQALRTAYAMRTLGRGGSALLPVLQKGSKELKEIFKDVDELGGGFNDKFIQQSHEVDVQLRRLKMGWRSIYVAIATEVLPFVKRFTEHAIKNVKVLIDFAKHTYGVRTALAALASGGVLFGLIRLLRIFNPFKMGIKDLMMALLSNAPLVLFVTLLGLAYLAIDDLYTFMKGGDSVLGRFLDQIGGQGTALNFWYMLRDAWNQLKPTIEPVIAALKDFGIETIKALIDNLPAIISWGGQFATFVVAVIDSAITGVSTLGGLLAGVFSAGAEYIKGNFSAGDKAIDTAWDSALKKNEAWEHRLGAYGNLANTFSKIGDPKSIGQQPAPQQLKVTPSGGLNLPPPPPVQVHVTNNISGAGNPQATASAVGGATKTAVKGALAAHRDAFAAVNAGMPNPGY
jgi:hypothetical protein